MSISFKKRFQLHQITHSTFTSLVGLLARALRAGDILVLSNGELVIVEWIQHEILESPVKVYNFEVEDFHTYFVGESSVLVHNQCSSIDADDLSITKNTSKHINNNHNPNKYAGQLKHKPQQDALKELEYKSFFNADWTKTQIDDAVNYGYNQAIKQGVTSGKYTFEYLSDTVTIALENGQVQTAYGDYHYTYQELLNLLK